MGYRKLGLRSNQRRAMLRNLTTSLFLSERVETTETRAKELQKIAEKMITQAKKGDLPARRSVDSYLFDKDVTIKLFNTIAPRYEAKHGGYTRIYKLGPRKGDAAPMAIIELT